jgi:molybdenum cofactor biosynthesis enzyme MoaA
MKFETFSVVVGDRACNANCKFCVSKITCNKPEKVSYNYRRLETAIRLARGFDEVIITGIGEPTLDRTGLGMITKQLYAAGFPIITLQTNGIKLAEDAGYAKELYDAGLSRVALSVCHADRTINNSIMQADVPNPLSFCAELRDIGFSTRLSVIVTKTAFDHPPEVGESTRQMLRMLSACAGQPSVHQVTLRELGGDSQWNKDNFLKLDQLENCLQQYGAIQLLHLPHGARVYDYHGQNIAITNCLTESTNPDQQRQLIYFPDGRIAYSWQHKGATLL